MDGSIVWWILGSIALAELIWFTAVRLLPWNGVKHYKSDWFFIKGLCLGMAGIFTYAVYEIKEKLLTYTVVSLLVLLAMFVVVGFFWLNYTLGLRIVQNKFANEKPVVVRGRPKKTTRGKK